MLRGRGGDKRSRSLLYHEGALLPTAQWAGCRGSQSASGTRRSCVTAQFVSIVIRSDRFKPFSGVLSGKPTEILGPGTAWCLERQLQDAVNHHRLVLDGARQGAQAVGDLENRNTVLGTWDDP